MGYDPGDDYTEENDDIKHQAAKSPAVVGEEDVFSGDAPTAEPADIDDELEAVGLHGDSDKGPRELGEE